MMPTTRQDFWVLYLREIMMRPRSSRDLSSALFTWGGQTHDRLSPPPTPHLKTPLTSEVDTASVPGRAALIVFGYLLTPPIWAVMRRDSQLDPDWLPGAVRKLMSQPSRDSFQINICFIPSSRSAHAGLIEAVCIQRRTMMTIVSLWER